MVSKPGSFGTFLIVGPTCFFLGILFLLLPYDYHVLWAAPPADALPGQRIEDYYLLQENNLKFLHSSPPLVARILNIVIGAGLCGFFIKLYKPSEANVLFDGASLALYMVGVVVYIVNIVKGLRMATAGNYYGASADSTGKTDGSTEAVGIGREDSLKVMAASNTILALVLVGVLVLQAGQWYAEHKEAQELADIKRREAEKKKEGRRSSTPASSGLKKRQ